MNGFQVGPGGYAPTGRPGAAAACPGCWRSGRSRAGRYADERRGSYQAGWPGRAGRRRRGRARPRWRPGCRCRPAGGRAAAGRPHAVGQGPLGLLQVEVEVELEVAARDEGGAEGSDHLAGGIDLEVLDAVAATSRCRRSSAPALPTMSPASYPRNWRCARLVGRDLAHSPARGRRPGRPGTRAGPAPRGPPRGPVGVLGQVEELASGTSSATGMPRRPTGIVGDQSSSRALVVPSSRARRPRTSQRRSPSSDGLTVTAQAARLRTTTRPSRSRSSVGLDHDAGPDCPRPGCHRSRPAPGGTRAARTARRTAPRPGRTRR